MARVQSSVAGSAFVGSFTSEVRHGRKPAPPSYEADIFELPRPKRQNLEVTYLPERKIHNSGIQKSANHPPHQRREKYDNTKDVVVQQRKMGMTKFLSRYSIEMLDGINLSPKNRRGARKPRYKDHRY